MARATPAGWEGSRTGAILAVTIEKTASICISLGLQQEVAVAEIYKWVRFNHASLKEGCVRNDWAVNMNKTDLSSPESRSHYLECY